MSDLRSRISDAVGAHDVRTRIHVLDEAPRIDLARTREVWRRARESFVAERPDDRAGTLVHRLYWGRDDALFSRDLGIASRDFAIVGRHSRCDLRLLDAEVSLRHLLVQGTRLADGRRILRAVDLRAQLPFHLLDPAPRRSIVATGPVVLRVGRWVVCAFPLDGSTPPADPPDVEVADAPDLASAVRSDPDESQVSSRITAIPGTTSVTDLSDQALGAGDAVVAVSRGQLRARVRVPRQDLERGVLVGRASRCLDAGIRDVLDAHISRAHVLLLSDGGNVFAYDLCSTNGTHASGRRVRVARLDDGGARLTLGTRTGVTLAYRRRA